MFTGTKESPSIYEFQQYRSIQQQQEEAPIKQEELQRREEKKPQEKQKKDVQERKRKEPVEERLQKPQQCVGLLPKQQQIQEIVPQDILLNTEQFIQQHAGSGDSPLFENNTMVSSPQKPKIPRPPNAFMLFANEWRKKLALQYPRESNKDISVR